jgi:hypothetical protein
MHMRDMRKCESPRQTRISYTRVRLVRGQSVRVVHPHRIVKVLFVGPYTQNPSLLYQLVHGVSMKHNQTGLYK